MKTAEEILSKYKSIPEQNLIHESSVIESMEEYKDECLLYCGPADWDGVAAARINDLKLALQDAKDQHKEACYVIGKMSIENTNLKEENNRLAVVVSAQEKEINEFEEQWQPSKQEQIEDLSEKFDQLDEEYQDLVRICTAIYKLDAHILKAMVNESLGGNNFEKLKDHLGV